jgi:hypothetical protein
VTDYLHKVQRGFPGFGYNIINRPQEYSRTHPELLLRCGSSFTVSVTLLGEDLFSNTDLLTCSLADCLTYLLLIFEIFDTVSFPDVFSAAPTTTITLERTAPKISTDISAVGKYSDRNMSL